MKSAAPRAALALLAVCMIFAFAGCGQAQQEQPQDPPHQEQPEELPGETPEEPSQEEEMKITLSVNGTGLTAALAETEAAQTLYEMLGEDALTLHLRDYGGWEKVGELGFSLPTSNEQMRAEPCDFVLYQGNQFVLFYGSNSWSYTRLGRIENLSAAELKGILGGGSITVSLSR